MNRIGHVVRLHTSTPRATFGPAIGAFGIAFAIVLAIGLAARIFAPTEAVRAEMYQGMAWNGAVWAISGPLIGLAIVAMTSLYDLALGLGLTRREYLSGTAVFLAAVVAAAAVFVTGMKLVEGATHGWFLQVRMFDVVWTSTGSWWHTLVQTFVGSAAVLAVGGLLAGIHRRWGPLGVWLLMGVLILAAAVLSFLVLVLPAVREAMVAMLGWPWVAWMGLLGAVATAATAGCAALLLRGESR